MVQFLIKLQQNWEHGLNDIGNYNIHQECYVPLKSAKSY